MAAAGSELLRAIAAPPGAPGSLDAAIRALSETGAWSAALDLLAGHRLLSLAAIRLDGVAGVPSEVRAALEVERRDATIQALSAAAELTGVLNLLSSAGIEAMPFKGPALALSAYGAIGARRMIDLDVVIAPRDRVRALTVLGDSGWRWPGGGPRTRDTLHRWLGHVPLERTGDNYIVELHWRFARTAMPWTLSVGDVLARAQAVRGAPDPAWSVPDAADHLLLLAWHGTRHAWERTEWLAAFVRVMGQCSEEDAMTAARTARRAGGKRALGVAVATARSALGVAVPGPLESVAAEAVAAAEGERIASRIIAGTTPGSAPAGHFGRHSYWVRVLDGAAARARFLALTALLPTARERELVALPDALAPLYYPLHVGRVAARALFGRTG